MFFSSNKKTELKKFFLSYSREDENIASSIVLMLRTTTTPIFFDKDSIPPGSLWRDKLFQAIHTATTIIILWSKTSSESQWVEEEWRLGVSLNKEIIPILLDDTPLPDQLRKFQWIDFYSNLKPLYREQEQIDAVRIGAHERKERVILLAKSLTMSLALFSVWLLVSVFHDSIRSSPYYKHLSLMLLLALSIAIIWALYVYKYRKEDQEFYSKKIRKDWRRSDLIYSSERNIKEGLFYDCLALSTVVEKRLK